MLSQTHTRIFTPSWGIMILLLLVSFCPVSGQDCSELEAENKQLKREISILRAENAELIVEVNAYEASNSFLRDKNDDLIEEVVPMRFWNTKYKRIEPRIAALEDRANKLERDSAKFAQKIDELKSSQRAESSRQQILSEANVSDTYKVNNIAVDHVSKSNIDARFYLQTLTKQARQLDEDILIKMKIFRKIKGDWEQIVYGEKGSATYDKYYKLAFCKANVDNKMRYHSINNFDPKKSLEYRLEFYHSEHIIGTHQFSSF